MRVIVLGGGVVGVTSAYYLARAGFEVVVIERQNTVARETSFANAGQVSPGYASPWAAPGIPIKAIKWLFSEHSPLRFKPTLSYHQYIWVAKFLANCTARNYQINKERMVRMAQYSRTCLAELRAETGIDYEQRMLGTTQLFRTQKQLDDAAKDIAVLEQMGIEYEILDKDAIIKVEPALAKTIDKLAGALRLPGDETGDCQVFTEQIAKLAQKLGVEFRFNQNIDLLEREGNQIKGVYIDGKLETADAYVVALGSYSSELLAQIGINAPVYPLKGYSLTVPIVNSDMAPKSTVLDETYKVAVTRLDTRIRVGGMAEIAGYDLTLNPKRRATLEKVVRDLYPDGGDLNQTEFWTGLRPATPDGTPLVGKTKFKNLYLNTGHGTLGWTMAAGCGSYLADLVAGNNPKISTEGLDISRYYSKKVMPIKRFGVEKRYSEAVKYEGVIYLSGNLADDYVNDIKAQTKATLDNIERQLIACGSNKERILSATIYLKNMSNYSAMNEVWDEWIIAGTAPARTCVESKLYDENALIEITIIAIV